MCLYLSHVLSICLVLDDSGLLFRPLIPAFPESFRASVKNRNFETGSLLYHVQAAAQRGGEKETERNEKSEEADEE